MIIKTTDKIGNGEIMFPTIGYSVKKNFQLSIPEKDYYKQDIQDGVTRGWLEVVMAGVDEEGPSTDMIQILNLTGGPLSIGEITLMRGASTFVTRDIIETTTFKTAIEAGLLEATDPTSKKSKSSKKETKKVAKKTTKKTTEKKDKVKKTNEESEEIDPNEGSPKTNMQAWNAHEQKTLSKDEATNAVAKQHNIKVDKDDKDDIQWVDGLEPDEKTDKTEKTDKKARKSYKVTSRKKKPKGSGKKLEAVGREREKIIDPDASVEFINVPRPSGDDAVDFVDIDQDSERIAKHPKLADQNSEVDLE